MEERENTNGKGTELAGAMVVEMTYLFLMIFLVFAFIVCEGVYLHDCYVLYAKAQNYAVDVAKEIAADVVNGEIDEEAWRKRALLWQVTTGYKDREQKAKEEVEQFANEGLLYAQKIDGEVDISAYQVEVKYHMNYTMPLFGVFRTLHLIPPSETTITAVAGFVEQEEFLRLLHSVLAPKK